MISGCLVVSNMPPYRETHAAPSRSQNHSKNAPHQTAKYACDTSILQFLKGNSGTYDQQWQFEFILLYSLPYFQTAHIQRKTMFFLTKTYLLWY